MSDQTDFCSFCDKPIFKDEEFLFSENFNCTIHTACLINALKDEDNQKALTIYKEFLNKE